MKSFSIWAMLFILTCLASGFVLSGCGCGDDDDSGGDDDDNNNNDDDAGDDTGDDDDDDDDATVGRRVYSLNGTWEVEESLDETPPRNFSHTAPVPGFLSLAEPPFGRVGRLSRERNYFWYRTTFDSHDQPRDYAELVIHKARFGVSVWLNGNDLGKYDGAFTAARFRVDKAMKWGETNTLLVRVGAWRTGVPIDEPASQDIEKKTWFPGIWDDVELIVSGTPHIVRTKIEPNIDTGVVKVLTTLRNDGEAARTVTIRTGATDPAGSSASSTGDTVIELAAGGETTVVQSVSMQESFFLWTPENPFLYNMRTQVLSSGEELDRLVTRFGMRTVEWRAGADKGFYLNGERMLLRGSNIAIHRFSEDPNAGAKLWDEVWIRKLLTENPTALHWNVIRFHLGRAPRLWYDIADEVGLLLADEYMFWGIARLSDDFWSLEKLRERYTSWVMESWNHPSIVWWDGANETMGGKANEVIRVVRELDSTRAWENGGGLNNYHTGLAEPTDPADPIEDHPYLSHQDMQDFDTNDGQPSQTTAWDDPTHAYIINEYGGLWLRRDGTPTGISRKDYRNLLGGSSFTPAEYREAYAYLVGGETLFWRAHRGYEVVQHFLYLGQDRNEGAVCDNFIDLENLILEPRWFEAAYNAFAPFAVYIDSWRDEPPADPSFALPLIVMNDHADYRSGEVRVVALADDGSTLSESTPQFVSVEPYGATSVAIEMETPASSRYSIFAILTPAMDDDPVVYDRRKIGFTHVGEPSPDAPAF